jgi:hypothetical protein
LNLSIEELELLAAGFLETGTAEVGVASLTKTENTSR